MSKPKKLFLLDSYALIFRSYYAFLKNPMRNNQGMNTSTVFGFTLTLDELLRKEDPSHILAAFDASGPTFRHEMYAPYKANRDATPEDIRESIPWVKELLNAYHIPVIEKLGYEADDIIGTIAKSAEKEGFEVYMVTPDKDFAQLVSKKIFMYKPARAGNVAEIIGVEEVKEKFRVREPGQVIDILALWGDSSDNIPGAPGIGEKTAKKLIESFGSIDGVYENITKLKGKQRENLENAREQVRLSRELATIIVDAPVDYDLKLAERKPFEKEQLSSIFDALNFKNLRSRILGEEEKSITSAKGQQGSLFGAKDQSLPVENTSLNNINTQEHAYHLVTGKKEIDSLFDQLEKQEKFCFDTETTGLDIIDSKIVGISFSWEAHKAYYIDFSTFDLLPEGAVDRLKSLFNSKDRLVIGQNLKYDLHMLKNYKIEVKSRLFDTMVAHYLVAPDRKHGLDAMAEDYFGYAKVKTEEMIGKKGTRQQNFRDLDPEKVKDYACEDADITWQLYQELEKQLSEMGLEKLSEGIEMPLVQVLMEMEHAGVSLDRQGLTDFAADLRKELIGIEKRIFELAGLDVVSLQIDGGSLKAILTCR